MSSVEPLSVRRWWTLALALVALTVVFSDPVTAFVEADPDSDPEVRAEAPMERAEGDLLDELEVHFRILRLRNGVVLEPRREDLDGIRTIEVVDGRFAIDGSDVSARELARRLGELAAPVIRLGELDEDELDSLFRRGGTGAMEISAPAAPAAPAAPSRSAREARPRTRYRSGDDTQLVVGNDLVVERGEVARDAVVIGGDLRVEGEVLGDAVAIGGSVRINGRVIGDVAAIGSHAWIGSEAEVGGDVLNFGGDITIDDGADLQGEVIDVPFGPNFRFSGWRVSDWDDWGGAWFDFSPWAHFFGMMWRFFGLILLALLACLAWLIGRGPIERIGNRIAGEPWKSGLVGLAAQLLFLPLLLLVVLILTVSIIGIPLLLLVPFALVALVVIVFLGYVAVAHRLGLWARERFGWDLVNPYVVLLVGLAILQVWTFVGAALDLGGGPIRLFAAMFLVFGFCVKYFAWTVGLGAALLTRFGTSTGWERSAQSGTWPEPPEAPGGGYRPPEPPAPAVPPTLPEADDRPFWERDAGESVFEEGAEAEAEGEAEPEPAMEGDAEPEAESAVDESEESSEAEDGEEPEKG